jgi:4-hydroxybenzoate polyprenyltransferase
MKSLIESLRTLLILGRISNLPTVWSNLLAASIVVFKWNDVPATLLQCCGGSCLYIGGMYLNDWCDAAFDAQYCPDRPIPAGKISRRVAGKLAIGWFLFGLTIFSLMGVTAFGAACVLVAFIVLYDFHHKNITWAPLVMGACRYLLYFVAALSWFNPGYPFVRLNDLLEPWNWQIQDGDWQCAQYVLPGALSLGLYVAGITYLARGESRPGAPTRWALLLLLLPVGCGIALTFAPPNYNHFGPLLPLTMACLLQLGWMAWLLIPLWRKTNPSIGRVVSGLLAGIVLVDMIAATPHMGWSTAWFLLLFVLALLLQRIIPAT